MGLLLKDEVGRWREAKIKGEIGLLTKIYFLTELDTAYAVIKTGNGLHDSIVLQNVILKVCTHSTVSYWEFVFPKIHVWIWY